MAFADTIRDIGLGLDTQLLDRPYTPGPARFIGRAISSYGQERHRMEMMQQDAAHRAAIKALEDKLGIPADFFLQLPADAQKQVLERSGVLKGSLKSEEVPGFGGKTYDEILNQGVPELPGTPSVNPSDFAMEGPPSPGTPGTPGLPPLSLIDKSKVPEAIARYQGADLRTPTQKTLDELNIEGKTLENANLRAGKSRQGRVSGGGTSAGGGKEAMDVVVAKRLASTQGGNWQDWLVRVRSGEFKYRRTGGKQVAIFAPDGSQVTTFTYEYGGGTPGTQASHDQTQAPDAASLPQELQAEGAALLQETDVAKLKRIQQNPQLPAELLPFVQFRVAELGG